MAKIDSTGRATDATLDEDPGFPTEAQPVDEPRPVMESTPGDKQDDKPASKRTTRR